MIGDVRTDRRRLLLSGLAFGAFVATRPWRTFVAFDEPSTIENLSRILPGRDGTLRIGHSYLQSYPDHADEELLADEVARSLGVAATTPRTQLARLAAATIHDELTTRDTIRLDGWIVAPTEARLAALATLASRPPDAKRSGADGPGSSVSG